MSIYTAMDSAIECDEISLLNSIEKLVSIARFARKHGCTARVVSTGKATAHVLVTNPAGEILVARTAAKLVEWLGY